MKHPFLDMDVFDFQNYTLAPDSEFPYADRETTCKTNLLWVLFIYCCRLSLIPFVEVRFWTELDYKNLSESPFDKEKNTKNYFHSSKRAQR